MQTPVEGELFVTVVEGARLHPPARRPTRGSGGGSFLTLLPSGAAYSPRLATT